MSRYLLLVLINLPLVVFAISGLIIGFKSRKINTKQLIVRLVFWVALLCALVLVYPLYTYLFEHDLTQTEPLSLFDVVLITAVIALLVSSLRLRSRVDSLEQKVNKLHQEVSIKTSD